MSQTTELTKTLSPDQRGRKMPLSTGGASGSSGLCEVSPRGTQECSDPSVHSSNLCEETIKRNPVWWHHHHHTHVTFQYFLLRDSGFKNGTKFKLLGRMPVFLAFHQRLMSSTAHFCFPSIPLSCLQHSLVIYSVKNIPIWVTNKPWVNFFCETLLKNTHTHLHPQQSPGSWELKANTKQLQDSTAWCCSHFGVTHTLDTQFIIWSEPKQLGSI